MRVTVKLLLPILIAAGSIAGCGKGAQTDAQNDRQAEAYAKSYGVDANVTTQKDGTKSVVIENNVGGFSTQVGGNLDVPAGFPGDVPVYPQLKIFSSSALPNQGHVLQGQSSDSMDRVAEFYAAQMKSHDWTDRSTAGNAAQMRNLQFQKENRTASVNLIPSPNGTTVQLMVAVVSTP